MRIGLVVLLSVLGGCVIDADYHVFGTEFEAGPGWRALLWPADADGTRFRVALDHGIHGLRVGGVPTLGCPPSVRELETLLGNRKGQLRSFLVLAPEGSSAALRSRADEMLVVLSGQFPFASAHRVLVSERWDDVRTTGEVVNRLRAQRRRAEESRGPEGTIFNAIARGLLDAVSPLCVIAPYPDDPSRFHVITTPTSDVIERGPPALRRFQVLDSTEALAVQKRLLTQSNGYIYVIVPRDTSSAHLDALDGLLREIRGLPFVQIHILRMTIEEPLERLRTGRALWSFLTEEDEAR